MHNILLLLAPGLFPSWDFFKSVEASPRLQWRLAKDSTPQEDDWHPFRPRPQRVSVMQMIKRLFWNPVWNETLYLTSLSERLLQTGSANYFDAIQRCLAREVAKSHLDIEPGVALQFRIVLVYREGTRMVRDVAYTAPPYALSGALK